jgi:beta-N-acetylhexosaminidase
MLIMGFNGTEIHDSSPVAQWLSDDGLGGVLLFDKDIDTNTYEKNLKTPTQIKHLIHQLNHYAKVSPKYENLPLFTAIDYEGGAVDRLAMIEDCMATLSAQELALLSDADLEQEVDEMAATLAFLGFNLNFAPVVDLNLNEQEGIIGKLKRSFSENPEQIVRVASKFVDGFSRYGIACAYKHFPGHGSAVGDTHEGFVDITNTFNSEELTPYYQLVKDTNKPVMIMTAHVINKHLDTTGLPATLSHKMLTGLLRETIGYDGVIISDDLQMQAISNHYSLEDSLCMTINAGADMVIFGNQLGSITAPEVINCIEQLVLSKKIDQQRIDDAYRRIVRLKQQMNCNKLIPVSDKELN